MEAICSNDIWYILYRILLHATASTVYRDGATMNCKIVSAKEWNKGGISLTILSGVRWFCSNHKIYFATNVEDPKPTECPILDLDEIDKAEQKAIKATGGVLAVSSRFRKRFSKKRTK